MKSPADYIQFPKNEKKRTPEGVTLFLDFSTTVLLKAGEIARSYFDAKYTVEVKKDSSFVTQVDKEIDLYIRETIEQRFPDHGIFSEEYSEKSSSSSSYRWILDPIDGTFSFLSGIPFYSILLALEVDDQLVFGAMAFPELHRIYSGGIGCPPECNGKPLLNTRRQSLSSSLILTTDPCSLYSHDQPFTTALFKGCKAMRTWADSYAYAMLLDGKADIALDFGMKLWDCAAIIPILEASQCVYDFRKRTADTYDLISATHDTLLQEVLALR